MEDAVTGFAKIAAVLQEARLFPITARAFLCWRASKFDRRTFDKEGIVRCNLIRSYPQFLGSSCQHADSKCTTFARKEVYMEVTCWALGGEMGFLLRLSVSWWVPPVMLSVVYSSIILIFLGIST